MSIPFMILTVSFLFLILRKIRTLLTDVLLSVTIK